jgi:uncharacterized protein YbgA (DUF1722 family)/uncharacterized protein YbbK (DUF523 family)
MYFERMPMSDYPRPKLLISKCLEHAACRYDGTIISSHFVKRLKPFVTFISICPEVEIGLSIPREAVRILYNNGSKRLVTSMSGQDYTDKMMEFSKSFVEDLKSQRIHGAVLKSRSPSCGIKAVKMYKTIGKVPCVEEKSAGIFGEEILSSDAYMPIEDENRLLNYDIRDHFLTRIFTLARFDKVKLSQKMSDLVAFQSDHKYLLMAYNQVEQKKMGRIVANHAKDSVENVIVDYEEHLKKAIMTPLKKGRNTNMILHMFGYVSDKVSDIEKKFFLEELDLYINNKKPLSAIMTMLHAWVIRFKEEYLLGQVIFEPYPIDILDVLDSGKGIK